MKAKGVPLADLPLEVREKLGLAEKPKRQRVFTAEDERRHALKLLAQIADLSKAERARVLNRAHKINEV